MKFGKELMIHLNETLPDWKDKYLCYKPLKKLLKAYTADDANADPLVDLQAWFLRILNEELDKFNDFYVDKEEEFVIRFQELKERIEKVKEKNLKGKVFTSESEFSEEVMDIRKDFVTIHGEMVLLKNYSSLNFAGLNKILKKYDKRTGGLLRLPFTQLALHQPFFTTEPLTRLVLECEANLELLFPIEAEVIESTSVSPDTKTQEPHNVVASSSEKPSTHGQETLNKETNTLQQSTLSAIRTLQGLRKASSTYDPYSLSSLNGIAADGSAGSVIVENSDTTTSSTSNGNDDGADQEEVRSA